MGLWQMIINDELGHERRRVLDKVMIRKGVCMSSLPKVALLRKLFHFRGMTHRHSCSQSPGPVAPSGLVPPVSFNHCTVA